MKYQMLVLSLLLGSALAPQAANAATTTVTATAEAATDSARVIVRFKAAAPSVRAKIMAAQESRASAQDIAQTRATGLGLRTGFSGNIKGLRAYRSLDVRTHVITASGISSAALVKRLALDSEIEMVVVDERRRHTAVTPNDPLYVGFGGIAPTSGNGAANGQWYLKAPAGEIVSSINASAAWDRTTGISSVVVAVLDTGVRKDHPDLAAQFVGGYDMISNAATAGDGGLRDDDASDPGDYVTDAEVNQVNGTFYHCTDPVSGVYRGESSSWHGTRVAGLIAAASNNGLGIAGVAWGVKILPIRVLGKCGGYDSDIMAGMKWAAGIDVPGLTTNTNPAKVLNLSLGGTASCSTTLPANPTQAQRDAAATAANYQDVISQVVAKGATIVVAAGNSEGLAVGLPGNCPGVIAVTGLRHVGSKVGFSSLGPEVAIAAPGGNCVNLSGACMFPMLSTTNSGTTTPVLADAAYTNNSASVGTSFSAPIVAGTVALMVSLKPALTPAEILALLKKTARPFVSSGATAGIAQCRAPTSTVQDECYCTTSTCGAGMLDAGAAVAAALGGTTAQTISFATLSNRALGSGALALTATASSGLAVSFASTTLSVCSVSGTTLSMLAVGTCSVSATQAGDATYAAATAVTRSFSVTSSGGSTAQTISFATLANQTLGAGALNLTATASSGLAVSYSSSTTAVCSVSGSVLSLLTAGTCTVTASQAGNSTYAPATPVPSSFQVSKATQTISVSTMPTQTMGSTVPALAATASSGLAVTFASATPAVCTVNGSTVGLVAAGTCTVTVTVNQDGNTTYAAAAPASISFTVVQAAQTISFNAPADQTLGVAAPALSATASSNLAVSFASSTPLVCGVSGNSLSLLSAGTCTVTASQAGDASYAAATPVARSFAVALAPVVAATESGGGGGGGAFSALWVLMLGFSTWLLRCRPLAESRCAGRA